MMVISYRDLIRSIFLDALLCRCFAYMDADWQAYIDRNWEPADNVSRVVRLIGCSSWAGVVAAGEVGSSDSLCFDDDRRLRVPSQPTPARKQTTTYTGWKARVVR